MNNLRKTILLGLISAGLGIAAVSSYAQSARCEHEGRQQTHGPADWMQQRQAKLHDTLKLKPDQEAAWTTYSAKMQALKRIGRPDRAKMASLSAPQRMDQMLAQMKEHEAKMTDMAAATKAFYDVLTPEQKQLFDQHFARHGHRRG